MLKNKLFASRIVEGKTLKTVDEIIRPAAEKLIESEKKSHSDDETKIPTFEQACFIIGLKALRSMSDETEELRERKKEIRLFLWDKISNYASSEYIKFTEGRQMCNDSYADAYQSLFMIFLEKLDGYDATKNTPTTYFKCHFRAEICKYLRNDITHLTGNDQANIRKIKAAEAYFDSQNIDYTIEMLAQRTGLSVPVVQNAIIYAHNCNYTNVEDAFGVASKAKTPEQEFLQKEMVETVKESLECLSDKEKEYILTAFFSKEADKFVYGTEDKEASVKEELPIKAVAELMGVTPAEATLLRTTALRKLNGLKELQSWNHHLKKKTEKRQIRLQDTATDMMQNNMLSAFGNLSN